MAKIILHVGPGKCGSSSIQAFFASHRQPCVQAIRYVLLNPKQINALNCQVLDEAIRTTFTQQLSGYIAETDTVILSHEYLFQAPYAIKHICSLAKEQSIDTVIIGYSRRQSNFLVSAYSQWWFRSLERVCETTHVLEALNLNPILFTGLERQIIACISNDFFSARQLSGYSVLDWHHSYSNLEKLTDKHSAVVKCGVLPSKQSDVSLIQDFCTKTGLNLKPNLRDSKSKISNLSFNQDIVEAINNAVFLGIEMPSPHQNNRTISRLSTLFSPELSVPLAQSRKGLEAFLAQLKRYVDSYYLESNQRLCQQYGLTETYFSVPQKLSKPEILDLIATEAQQRTSSQLEIIQTYRMLSAKVIKLCMTLEDG